jgi:glycosyltransferase involved in cell wall biosynthesis
MASPKLRLVIVTHEAPDPFGHPSARWYAALVKGLVDRGHDVCCLAALSTPGADRRARKYLSSQSLDLRFFPFPRQSRSFRQKIATLREPFSYFISDELRSAVQQEVKRGYDVLHLEQVWCGYLGRGLSRTLLSVHHLQRLDLAGTGFRNWSFFKAKHLAWRGERALLRSFADIRVLTDRLARSVTAINPMASIYTVPIAIDPALYPVFPLAKERVVGLIAGMTWEPGVNAAVRLITRIWPRVLRSMPNARLHIAGWNARQTLAQYLGTPRLTIDENIAHSFDFYKNCAVLAYPLSRGSGMKVKILEALAMGVPIVTTNEGSEGIEMHSGVHGFVEDDDDAFAARVLELMDSDVLRSAFAKAGRDLVEERYSPEATVPRIEDIYTKMLN